jgi:hypothetical protein
LPVQTVQAIQTEINQFGGSIQDFIRMRIQSYFTDPEELTLQEKKDIRRSEVELKKGRFKSFSDADKLEKYLSNL